MAGTSTKRQYIPGPASKEEENLIHGILGPASKEVENLTEEPLSENFVSNVLMGAPLSRLKGAPWGQLMGDSALTKTVREIYSNCEELDHSYYRPLYHAALKGDWQAAKCFLEANPGAATARVSVFGSTALHSAALEGHAEFVEKLLEVMPAEAVALPDVFGETALHYAAGIANMKSVKALVRKYPPVTQSMDFQGWTPLMRAVDKGPAHKEMPSSKRSECKDVIWFLSLVTTDEEPARPFSGPEAGNLAFLLTCGGYYDLSLYLLKRYPNLLVAASKGVTALRGFAMRPADFYSGFECRFWENLMYSFVSVQPNHAPPHGITGDIENIQEKHVDLVEKASSVSSESQAFCWMRNFAWKGLEYLVPSVKKVREAKLRHQQVDELLMYIFTQISHKKIKELTEIHMLPDVIAAAAKFGVVEMISICLLFIPDLIWFSTPEGYIMEIAIRQRQEKIFTLMNDITPRNQLLAYMVYLTGRGHLLHIAAKLAPASRLTSVSGAAFQIQRELLWFEEVKKLIPPADREIENEHNKTPWEFFLEEHEQLLEKGERWMKDTANYLMVVATLIATVVFAAAFTVPGGNKGDSGIPNLLGDNSFLVLVISVALALFSSVTALLMFLSILTARYAAEDFLRSLPQRLIIGLAALFFAIVTMMIAFGATLSIVLAERGKWFYIPVTLLASFPAIMFMMLQLPLLIQMIQSTYGSGFFRPKKLW